MRPDEPGLGGERLSPEDLQQLVILQELQRRGEKLSEEDTIRLELLRRGESPEEPKLKRLAKVGASSVVRAGASMIGGAVGDMRDLAKAGRDALPAWTGAQNPWVKRLESIIGAVPNAIIGAFPTTKQITSTIGKVAPALDTEPVTSGEKYLDAALGGAAGMALPIGGASTAFRLGSGTVSGLAGEGASRMADDKSPILQALLRILGNIGGTVPAAVLAAKKPQIAKLAQDLLQDTSPQANLTAADKARAASDVLGTQVLYAQGFPEESSMHALLREVARSPQGKDIRQVVSRQGATVDPIPRGMANDISGLPTDVASGHKVAQALADTRWNRPRNFIKRQTDPIYKQAADDVVRGDQVLALANLLDELPNRLNLAEGTAAAKKLQEYASILRQNTKQTAPGRVVGADGRPLIPPGQTDTNAAKIDSIIKEIAATLDDVQSGSARGALVASGGEVGLAHGKTALLKGDKDTEGLTKISEAISRARERTHQLHIALTDPREKSILVNMTAKLTKDKTVPAWDDFTSVLEAGSNASASDVRKAWRWINATDKEAWPLIVKNRIMKTEDAAKQAATYGGRTSTDWIGDYVVRVRGTSPESKARFLAELEGVGEALGFPDPKVYAKAQNNIIDAMEIVARDRHTIGQVDYHEMKIRAGENLGSWASRTANAIAPLQTVGAWYRSHLQRSSYEKLSDIFTKSDPHQTRQLLEDIAKWDPTDARMRALAQELIFLVSGPAGNTPE